MTEDLKNRVEELLKDEQLDEVTGGSTSFPRLSKKVIRQIYDAFEANDIETLVKLKNRYHF